MLVFAIDLSTSCGSAVLWRDGTLLSEANWPERRLRNQQVFTMLPALFADGGARPAEVDRFAVGLGPGAFSGLRVSLALACGMALPGNRLVTGVGSGEALAWTVRSDIRTPIVAVVGDARRERLWWGLFQVGGTDVTVSRPCALTTGADMRSGLGSAVTLVTSDWEALGDRLRGIAADTGAALLEGPRTPSAQSVAELSLHREACAPTEAMPVPLYLHPPVFVDPIDPPVFPRSGEAPAARPKESLS